MYKKTVLLIVWSLTGLIALTPCVEQDGSSNKKVHLLLLSAQYGMSLLYLSSFLHSSSLHFSSSSLIHPFSLSLNSFHHTFCSKISWHIMNRWTVKKESFVSQYYLEQLHESKFNTWSSYVNRIASREEESKTNRCPTPESRMKIKFKREGEKRTKVRFTLFSFALKW